MVKESINYWIEQRKLRGYYVFSYEDVRRAYPSKSEEYISTSLTRLIANKTIINPTRGFYVIIPIEYALTGVVPAVFYIDRMMEYLNRKYYVGLLNAASFYGAAHQRPQSFCVMNDKAALRNGERAGIDFTFVHVNHIYSNYLNSHKGKLGNINVSSPELTAIDLVAYQNKIGGLNRVCTVMNELTDSLDFNNVGPDFFAIHGLPVYQRLGYILEYVLEEYELSGSLYTKMNDYGFIKFRKIPFKIGKSMNGSEQNKKWKVNVNQEIEIDV